MEIFDPIGQDHVSQYFYTTPLIDEIRTPAQLKDKKLCKGFGYFLRNYLTVSHVVEYTYIGFESNAFCSAPVLGNDSWWSPTYTNPAYACDRSVSGFYTPVCRGWYILQHDNQNKSTMGDLYQYANGNIFGITFCVPLEKQG